MRPILALNCLLQIEQERSEEESSVGDALALAFRCARFCSASLILFASYSPAPLFMRPRHFVRTCAICSHDSVGMLKKKGKRKVQGVPQSQTAALPKPQEEEETDKSKQAQTEQTYKKH